ncbi:TniQ family protein [Tardiphaga sp. 804_B3_N1_9]|uniref:TniQ family protein n=1 Tax=Tardiphaga sp. 804_B3_N1_9 TaxID=3240786 RepID=UPI003F2325FF
MVLPLGLTVPFMEDEPTTYFASRLAARNFLNARPFAADLGFSYSALDRGCEVAISRLSEIAGVPISALTENASRPLGEWLQLRGQLIDPKSRRNSRLAVCPACLEADVARGDRDPSIAIRGRLPWTLKSIRTCAVHHMALVNIPQNDRMPLRHDWSQLVAPVLPQIKALTDSTIRRPPSKLEGYLIDRLQGNADECWLNSMEFYAAEHLAQLFGSAALYGDKVALNLSDDEKYTAGDVGFDIVKDGPKGIPDFLSKMQSQFVRRDRTAGAASVYGRIYARLTVLSEDPGFASVHDIVSDHIMSSFPVGPGDFIFRKPVSTRRYHSVLTLSKQFGCRESRIEKVLRLEGLLPDRHDSGRDVLFEAARAEQLIEREMQSLTLAEAERRLGASANVMKILLDGGFVQRRRVSKGPHGLRFWADELDSFLARILEGTQPVEENADETMSVSYASAHARCTISTIFQLILDRKLRWVGRRIDRSGLDALLVNPEDLRHALNRPTEDGLSAIDAAERLRLAPAVMRRLAERKILGSFTIRDPMTGHEKLRFAPNEIDRFASAYVSLFNLGRTLGQKAARVRKDLDARGVKPAQELLGLDAIFYRRSDLEIRE